MSEQDHDRAAPRPLTPTIFFILLVGVLLLAIGIWTGNDRGPAAGPAGPDSLVINAPLDSTQVAAPLEIAFSTAAPLRLSPMGWQAGSYHIHAIVDTAQVESKGATVGKVLGGVERPVMKVAAVSKPRRVKVIKAAAPAPSAPLMVNVEIIKGKERTTKQFSE